MFIRPLHRPFPRLPRAVLIALPVAASLLGAPALASPWTVDAEKSHLGFSVDQGGNDLKGTFETWTAQIDFDPEAPENAKLSATIATGSATTGNNQFDDMLPSAGWFASADFPEANFEASNVTATGEGIYEATGSLSIRGVSLPVTLTFQLDINGDTAHAVGTATLDRMAYKLGADVAPSHVNETVTVKLDLTATR